ncbi:MAG: hypothetical protein IPL65_15985 [Lewinellaceae bacterium]|nr:hypothetical protein [Lewinellaceae bacterium]
MIILASRITSLTDARYFAAKNVSYLGFNLESNAEGFLDPIYMKAIREWVEGPQIVGAFSHTPVEEIREAAIFYGLDAVELSDKNLSDLSTMGGIPVLLRTAYTGDMDALASVLEAANGKAVYIVVENLFWSSISAAQADWRALCSRAPLLLDIDVSPTELPAMLDALQPAGLSFSGSEEEKVGVKSFDEIDALFDVLETLSGL